MNYTNFNRTYITDPTAFIGSNKTIEVHIHKYGAECIIDTFGDFDQVDDYVFVRFNSGKCVGVTLSKQGHIKIATDDDFRQRDLSSHPSWNISERSRKLLVRIFIRHILSRILNENEVAALQDLAEYNFEVLQWQ